MTSPDATPAKNSSPKNCASSWLELADEGIGSGVALEDEVVDNPSSTSETSLVISVPVATTFSPNLSIGLAITDELLDHILITIRNNMVNIADIIGALVHINDAIKLNILLYTIIYNAETNKQIC